MYIADIVCIKFLFNTYISVPLIEIYYTCCFLITKDGREWHKLQLLPISQNWSFIAK